MSLTAFTPTIAIRISGSARKTVSGVGTVGFLLNDVPDIQGFEGTINELYIATRTLAGGASENLDLAGSLTDVFGDTITLARINFLKVELLDTTAATSITFGPLSQANAWTGPFANSSDGVSVRNKGYILFAAPDSTGWAVTAGTGDILRIVNNDGTNTATYKITILGRAT